jgi:acyl-CoA synthetase (NDP forming)
MVTRSTVTQRRADLEQFFRPDGVVIFGSVDRATDPAALRAQLAERWGERVFLVNPRGGAVGEIPIYERIADIGERVGLAVINVRPDLVPDLVEQCGEHGVAHVLVFTAGFSEVGPEGSALERRIAEIARRFGMRVFGPNTNTNAFERMPDVPNLRGGKIGLVTQSGHQGRPIVQGAGFGVGFSRWVPTGNEADLEVADFIEYFAYDDDTAVIAGYFEGFRDAAKLRRALEAANAQAKPVVALKIGRTSAGSRMASSHTGHLTGSDAVVDGLFRQYGVTRVDDLDELLETAALFAKLSAGTGPNVCCYSISGGSSTLMVEVAEQHGVPTPALSPATQEALRAFLPSYLTVANPVDNGGSFVVQAPPEDRRRVLELILADDAVDLLVVGLTAPAGTMTDTFADDVCAIVDAAAKPIVVTWNSPKTDERGFEALVAAGLPMFRSFRNCFRARRAFADYTAAAPSFRARAPVAPPPASGAPLADAAIGPVSAGRARALLEAHGIPLAGERTAGSAAEAASAAEALGWPVVMKLASPAFPHKSDAGLVRLGVASAADAARVHDELVALAAALDPDAAIEGVLVQEQIDDGVEMIVGVTHDSSFGPAVMVGMGGIFAEIVQDVAVRPVPLDRGDASEMVHGLRGYPLLRGARGRPPVDVEGLVDLVVSVAELAAACGPDLAELDLNPVLVRERGVVVVDSLVVAAGA